MKIRRKHSLGKFNKILFSFILIVSLLLQPISLLTAHVYAAYATPIVRIAYIPPEIDSMEFLPVVQIYKSYMDEIAKYAGWKYNFYKLSPKEAAEKLESGEVDLILPVEHDFVNYAPNVVFSKTDVFDGVLALYFKENSPFYYAHINKLKGDKISNINMADIQGARVGLLRNQDISDRLRSFVVKSQMQVTPVYFSTLAEMESALENGNIDIMVDKALRVGNSFRQMAVIDVVPAYIGAKKENQYLIDQLDKAFVTALEEDTRTINHLRDAFYGISATLTTHYTMEELRYINSTPPVKVVFYGQQRPFVWLDEAFNLQGIYPDILRKLSESTGLPFEFVYANDYEQAQGMLLNGSADMMLDIYSNDTSRPDFYFSNPIYEERFTFVGLRDEKMSSTGKADHNTFIIPHPLPPLINFVNNHIPNCEIETSSSVNAALIKANNHISRIAVVEAITLQSEGLMLMFPNLTNIPTASMNVPLSLAISPNRDIILRSIINKGITRLVPEQMEQIVLRHTVQSSPNFSASYIISHYPLQIGLGFSAFALMVLFVGFTIYNNNMNRKKNKELAHKNEILEKTLAELKESNLARDGYRHMAERDALTGVYNKAGIEQLCRSEFNNMSEQPNTSCAFFIIDLDHFKQLNDTCGHQKGDEILQKFASALQIIVRKDDYVGRFGGDEFILLLRNIKDRKAVIRIARMINVAALALDVGDAPSKVSASIGIALAPSDAITYEEIFKCADRAVYQVKEHGRNGYYLYSDFEHK